MMWILGLCVLVRSALTQQVISPFGYDDPANIVKNYGFEYDISWPADWWHVSCQIERVSDAHTGSFGMKVSAREYRDSGLFQQYPVSENKIYYYSVFFKLLNNATSGYTKIRAMCRFIKSTGGWGYINSGAIPFLLAEGYWMQLGGDFKIPTGHDITQIECFHRIEELEVNYIIDSVGLIELVDQPDWNSYLNDKISQHRLSDVTIRGNLGSLDPASTQIEVNLVKHEFLLGTAIKCSNFIGSSEKETNYRNFVLSKFNCAVFENKMKWKQMEKYEGYVDYSCIDAALVHLKANNMTIRSHALLWDSSGYFPTWLDEEGQALIDEIDEHLNEMNAHFHGQFQQIDVCNEYIHGHSIETLSQKYDMLEKEFRDVHAMDPDAKLYLNDFQIVKDNFYTSAAADLANILVAKGVPVHGNGVQAHLRTLPIPNQQLEQRLKVICTGGLPVAITELSVHSDDMSVRASSLDIAVRLMFAEPCVESIILWGFADAFNSFAPDMFLTSGPTFELNEAGQKLFNLFENEWSTKESFVPSAASFENNIRAYHGKHKLDVTVGGNIVFTTDFYVSKEGQNVVDFSIP